jgi:hypothetical protein
VYVVTVTNDGPVIVVLAGVVQSTWNFQYAILLEVTGVSRPIT